MPTAIEKNSYSTEKRDILCSNLTAEDKRDISLHLENKSQLYTAAPEGGIRTYGKEYQNEIWAMR